MRGTHRLLLGDVRDRLRDLDRHSVHCVVTSPPYLGLRDYGIEGQIGREPWQEHIKVQVEVFHEVHRVLHPSGTLWLNYGDAYAQKGGKGCTPEERAANVARAEDRGYYTGAFSDQSGWDRAVGTATGGLKPKDLMGMPWRIAFALQEAGWWLRADNIWSKNNPTPEPPRGRPTMAHEYVFLLAKAERYFYDDFAVRVPHSTQEKRTERIVYDGKSEKTSTFMPPHPGGRNLWTVWQFPTQPFPVQGDVEHFATFPEELARICILAGTSEKGCCPACLAPWRRLTEPTEIARARLGKSYHPHEADHVHGMICGTKAYPAGVETVRTTGWEPTCQCPTHEPVPCTVLDPFAGSGTAGVVALRLGRSFVGVELNPDYHRLATRRLETALLPVPKRAAKPRQDDPQLSLLENP